MRPVIRLGRVMPCPARCGAEHYIRVDVPYTCGAYTVILLPEL